MLDQRSVGKFPLHPVEYEGGREKEQRLRCLVRFYQGDDCRALTPSFQHDKTLSQKTRMGNYRAKTNDKATRAGSSKIYDNLTFSMRIERAWNNCRAVSFDPPRRLFAALLSSFLERNMVLPGFQRRSGNLCHSTNSFEGTIAYFVLVVAGRREGKIQAGELLLSASVSCLQRVVRSPAEQEISHARDSRGETVADKETR